jgi:hypothetical protein
MTDEMLDEKRIRELILGVCHLMSSRDVIVAVNIKGNDAQAEKSTFFNEISFCVPDLKFNLPSVPRKASKNYTYTYQGYWTML